MTSGADLFGQLGSGAVLSPCTTCMPERRAECADPLHRPYRYRLHREWDRSKSLVGWVMLNPSTADAEADDPTIRRCVSFSRSWGYGGIVVVNLFALRATDPSVLRTHPDPVGDNDGYIDLLGAEVDAVVCAWGAHPFAADRADAVAGLLSRGWRPHEVRCLGTTKAGHPKHPLYVKASTPLVPYEHVNAKEAA